MQAPVFVPNLMETPWTAEEHNLFLQGYLLYGDSWIEIAEIVRTRNAYQVCSYASWLKHHGCLPRLPPIQQAARLQRVGYASTAIATPTIAPAMAKLTTITKINKGLWSKDEHALFLKGVEQCGRGNWTRIADIIKTRNSSQVVSHARYFKKLYTLSGHVSGTKRKALEAQEPKGKKKRAATTPTKEETKTKGAVAVALPQQPQASSSTLSGVQPVPSAPSVLPPDGSVTNTAITGTKKAESLNSIKTEAIPEPSIETDAEGNPTLDVHPPSVKAENASGEVIPPQREKVIGDKTGTKQEDAKPQSLDHTKHEAIKVCDHCVEITRDPEDVVTTPLSSLLGPREKIVMIAIILLVSILLAGTIFVYSGSGNGEISSGAVADSDL